MTTQYYSESLPEIEYVKPIDVSTHHILFLDDNVRLSSMIARYVLLGCQEYGRSCALYHLGQAGKPNLTYYTSGQEKERQRGSQPLNLEYALFVAATPRHAMSWLDQNQPAALTVVADVRLQGDIDLRLIDLIDMLAELELPVYFVFLSNDSQNQFFVKPLIEQRKGLFITKDSSDWASLPRRLVEHASRFPYYPAMAGDYDLLARLSPPVPVGIPSTPARPSIYS